MQNDKFVKETNYPGENSWAEYRRMVTQGLIDLDGEIKECHTKIEKTRDDLRSHIDTRMDDLNERFRKMELRFTIDVTTLKTKAGTWGAILGAIAGGGVAAIIQAAMRNK